MQIRFTLSNLARLHRSSAFIQLIFRRDAITYLLYNSDVRQVWCMLMDKLRFRKYSHERVHFELTAFEKEGMIIS